ncbi:MAG: DUF433 domain-containing protein [Proteobacteria bacterium]|nr:MAG: DUF433 domain-containing protein [Pseudomonadota bacterium]
MLVLQKTKKTIKVIKCDPTICFGQPALVGRRLTVYDIVTKIFYEDNIDTAIDDYEIRLGDALDALAYCKELKCRIDENRRHYCDGCILRTISEGAVSIDGNFLNISKESDELIMSDDGKIIFQGSLNELKDSEFGKVTYLMADYLFSRYSSSI